MCVCVLYIYIYIYTIFITNFFFLELFSSYFRDSEPSALEGLIRGFISSPLSFLKRVSSVDWPSWRSERHGRSFPRFPLGGETLLSRSILFQLLSWSFRLGFNSPTILLPGAKSEEPFLQLFVFKRGPTHYADVGASPEVKSLVLVFVFWIDDFVLF